MKCSRSKAPDDRRTQKCNRIQGYLAHKKTPTPKDHHRSLGIGPLKGPTKGLFLRSEVPLYSPLKGYRGDSKVRTRTARRKVLIDLP